MAGLFAFSFSSALSYKSFSFKKSGLVRLAVFILNNSCQLQLI